LAPIGRASGLSRVLKINIETEIDSGFSMAYGMQLRAPWRGEARSELESYWSVRAKVAASLIAPNGRVLDLGCGACLLRRTLPEGCEWLGYDLRPQSPDVVALDLDAGEFPDGNYDYIVLLGVLTWLKRPVEVLKRARRSAPYLIASDRRSRRFWRTADTSEELEPMLPGTGWALDKREVWQRGKRDNGKPTDYVVCRLR
jgi:SAM-dependent methyltransferase